MKKNIIIGSRGSILALAQANLVKEKLEKNNSYFDRVLRLIKSDK